MQGCDRARDCTATVMCLHWERQRARLSPRLFSEYSYDSVRETAIDMTQWRASSQAERQILPDEGCKSSRCALASLLIPQGSNVCSRTNIRAACDFHGHVGALKYPSVHIGDPCLLEAKEAATLGGVAAQPLCGGRIADIHQRSHKAVLPGRPQSPSALRIIACELEQLHREVCRQALAACAAVRRTPVPDHEC